MARLASITKIFLSTGQNDRAEKCIELASRLYESGGSELRNAVANVYLYTLTLYIEVRRLGSKNLLTPALLNEYRQQVAACGD